MDIPQLPVTRLKQWLDDGKPVRLLDVRTDEETQICALPDALHIPMNLIPLRHNELPDDDIPLVIYCHHGIRSLHTAMYLADVGFDNLYNLQGGIDAWSTQVDENVPRY
ncbi:rhodanese-like domain-containing protein [Neisseria perflava]|uniref:rhodanese-like domain-containing protein n=1 Tax=Neisseria perflava TaxID=33053 RepID=UPI00209CC6D0|nr:rhodanese-like domain-containing protein [Neisseria perflava]MCP1660545.1 rhodanese-related sulfurtransferase [Neisseria perflava]MCP1772695.1 rhodanese-related sulfurtransferase [Neisseria perflava]